MQQLADQPFGLGHLGPHDLDQCLVLEHADVGVIGLGGHGHAVAVAVEVEIAHFLGLQLGHAQAFQCPLAAAHRRVEVLAHDLVGTRVVQLVGLLCVVGTGHDLDARVGLAGELGDLHGLLVIVDGHHQQSCLGQPGNQQQLLPGGVTEIGLDPEALVARHRGGVVVDHRGLVTAGREHGVDDAPEAAVAGDDHRVLLLDHVGPHGITCLGSGIGARHHHLVVEDEQQRREQHRQRHRQQQLLGDVRGHHAVALDERQQHEAELTGLRQRQRKELLVQPLQAEHLAQQQQDQALGDDHAQRDAQDLPALVGQQLEVDAGAHRDEEQPQQQPLERLDVAFQLVPVFAVGQHHASQEGA